MAGPTIEKEKKAATVHPAVKAFAGVCLCALSLVIYGINEARAS